MAARFSDPGMPFHRFATRTAQGPRWTGNVELVEKHLADPLKWRGSKRIFVNSMSDLFHENLSDEAIAQTFAVMAVAQRHTYQVLTKRPERMALLRSEAFCEMVNMFASDLAMTHSDPNHRRSDDARAVTRELFPDQPLPNVWLGVSTEDQAAANERIPYLLQTPAAVRFLSCEPLLGAVDLTQTRWPGKEGWPIDVLRGGAWTEHHGFINVSDLPGQPNLISWVIVGGESGPGARPMQTNWARSLRDQCQEAGVAYFFKQWGEFAPARIQRVEGCLNHTGGRYHFEFDPACNGELRRLGKHAAGDLLDGRQHHEFPAAREEVKP